MNVLQVVSMKRDAVMNLRVPGDVKDALQRAADADFGRSMSSMAVRIFQEWLTEHGHLKPAPTNAAKAAKRKGRKS